MSTRASFRAVLLAGLLAVPALAEASAGKVSFLTGKAFRQAPGGAKVALAVGTEVEAKDVLTTEARSRLEITLADQSLMRLAPSSQAELSVAEFQDDTRKVSAKLVLGNVWAKVATSLGGDQKFEVTTEKAVAGVRGTTFRVDANKDKSSVVKVFAGAVAVAGSRFPMPQPEQAAPATEKGKKPPRTQVGAPKQVTKAEWEKLVAAQMQVRVAADGSPSEVEKFAQNDACADEWTRWNLERDGEPCAAK